MADLLYISVLHLVCERECDLLKGRRTLGCLGLAVCVYVCVLIDTHTHKRNASSVSSKIKDEGWWFSSTACATQREKRDRQTYYTFECVCDCLCLFYVCVVSVETKKHYISVCCVKPRCKFTFHCAFIVTDLFWRLYDCSLSKRIELHRMHMI